jgi:hypothetical protein
MITPDNLQSHFQRGKPWPPTEDVSRLKIYADNLLLWQRKHDEVYTILKNLYADREKDFNRIIFIINFHKQLSTFWADLLLSEKPIMKAGIATGEVKTPEQIYLDSLISRLSLWSKAYAARIDMSRYGVGVAKVYAEEGKPAKLQIISPKSWWPVVGPDGEAVGHVIAWALDNKLLNVEIHSGGLIQSCKFDISDQGEIKSDPYDIIEVQTGFDEPLVFPMRNASTTDDVYGTDDYQDIDPMIKRLEITFTRSGRTLDAHSEPAFAVPDAALGPPDPVTNERSYNAKKKIFPISEGDSLPQYITWDGQLVASFTLIDKVLTQLYTISETCKCAFEPDTLGNAISGKALRMLMMRPLKKSERCKLQYDPVFRQILEAISVLDVKNKVPGAVLLADLNITWKDGLPEDNYEEAQIDSMRITGGSRSPQGIMRERGFSEKQIVTETDEIKSMQGGML